MTAPSNKTVRYRATLPAWLFIGGLSNLPWLIAWADSALKINYWALAFAFFVSSIGFGWLMCFQIVITSNELIFQSLFAGKQNVRHDQIKKVSLALKFWQTNGGPLRLVVEDKQNKQTSINAKVFSRAAIQAVLELGSRTASQKRTTANCEKE